MTEHLGMETLERLRMSPKQKQSSRYFSFFGSVEIAAPGKAVTRAFEQRDDDYDYERSCPADVRDYLPSPIEVVSLGDKDSLIAEAWRYRGYAVLIVSCFAGGWQECGAVKWPLEFDGPAQVAGSCCNPQYGLG